MATLPERPVPFELLDAVTAVLIQLDGPRCTGEEFNDVLRHLAAAREAWQKLPGSPARDDLLPRG